MISTLHWGTFLLWGIFDVFIALYAWYGLTETRGRTLEEIAAQGRSGVMDADPGKLRRERSAESDGTDGGVWRGESGGSGKGLVADRDGSGRRRGKGGFGVRSEVVSESGGRRV